MVRGLQGVGRGNVEKAGLSNFRASKDNGKDTIMHSTGTIGTMRRSHSLAEVKKSLTQASFSFFRVGWPVLHVLPRSRGW